MCGRTACAAKNWWRRFTFIALSQIVRRHRVDVVAVVVGGVVDEHGDRSELGARRRAIAAAQRVDVGQVAVQEQRPVPALAELGDQRLRRLGLDVDEGDLGAVAGKGAHHRGADARAAAGDEHDATGQAGIAGEIH